MGLEVSKRVVINQLGPSLKSNFGLDELPNSISFWKWYKLKENINFFTTETQLVIAKTADFLSRIIFLAKLDSLHPNLVRFSLYAEEGSIPIHPYKSNGTEFFKRSIAYLSAISPHGAITGMIAQWHVGERNHNEFIDSYDPLADNFRESALKTWTGSRASNLHGFSTVSKIPGIDHKPFDIDHDISLIFSKHRISKG